MDQSPSKKSNRSKGSNSRGPNKGANSNGKGNAASSSGRRSSNGKSPNGGNGRSSDARSRGSDDQRQASARRRKGPRKRRVDPTAFWGDPEKLTEASTDGAAITTRPSAVVESLGRAPLAGQQNAADLYFEAIYGRSVNLAAALAAAGGLVEADEIA